MGGDKLLPEVTRIDPESADGRAIADRRAQIFADDYLPHLRPFRDAGRLVAALKARGLTVVAASSAKRHELQPLLAIAGADMLMDDETSSDDAARSKPDPDIIHAALQRAKVGAAEAVMILPLRRLAGRGPAGRDRDLRRSVGDGGEARPFPPLAPG